MKPADPMDNKPVLACSLEAINTAERPRYHDLVKRVRAAMRERVEIADGYAFKLDPNAMTLPEANEWITMERLCCSFLTILLSDGLNAEWTLTMTGPAGTKPIIAAEFPEP